MRSPGGRGRRGARRASPVRVRTGLAALLLGYALLGCALSGCSSDKLGGTLLPNIPPSIEFTHAPVGPDKSLPEFYAYRVFWSGNDPDGRIDHYEYCVDPTRAESVWVKTPRAEELLLFRATEPEGVTGPSPRALSFHTLVIRAVDDRGAMSPRKHREFFSWTTAPSVRILAPGPSALLQASIVPSVFIRWEGTDPDGQLNSRPIYYRHQVFDLDDPANRIFLSDPDSLRRREAPGGFADWDSSGAESTFVRLTNLTPGKQYLFALVGYDEAGAYSPLFSLYDNLLQMYVTFASVIGPRIRVYNTIVDFTYDSGGYTVDPLRWIAVESAAGVPAVFNWEAFATQGSAIAAYRWGVDLANVSDNTPRTDEVTDIQRWSRPSPLTTSATLAGIAPGDHFLYIEATDNNGLASLGIVHLTVVRPTFAKPLLVVDDTRLEPDKLVAGGCADTYKQFWPSAAELDTFLFARGGVPWRCTKAPASGALSSPGLFAGYEFDTLGTRLGLENPTNGVRLSRLGDYRNVVWLVDSKAASNFDVIGLLPMPVLRYMSSPGRASTLGAYVQGGGRVWLLGGGAGTVATDPFNRARNDDISGRIYSNREGELASGRLLYDAAHWRSAFSATVALVSITRAPRAEAIADAPWAHEDAWGGGTVRAPDYRRLPEHLRDRDPVSDPLPPTRVARQANLYYRSSYACEYLVEPNEITEDVDLSPAHVRTASVLDTLMEASSSRLLNSPAPTMTYYHGFEANRFVFSGFAPWDFQRVDAIALVDFVLQELWGLPRQPLDRGLIRAGGAAGPRPGSARGVHAGRAATAPGTTGARVGYEGR
jgi:hypothetical protein